MKYSEISIGQIFVGKNHFKDKCQNGDIVTLARNIKKLGVLEPIIVKPLICGGYEIVAGNRRYCAARLAGIKRIPCMVLEKGESMQLIALSVEMLSDGNAFDVAEKLKQYLVQCGKGAEGVYADSGVEVPILLEYLSPICLSEIEKRIAIENKLSNDIIRKISALPTKEERLEALSAYVRAGESSKKISVARKPSNSRARRRASIKGLGFFENTLKRSLELLEGAGIHTERITEEKANEIEYRIKVSNKA